MSRLIFPLLCWPIENDLWIGQIIGTEMSLTHHSINGLKRLASEWLKRQLREGDLEEPAIPDPVLSLPTVMVQLAYQQAHRTFPLSSLTPIKVAAVHHRRGQQQHSHVECYLPLLNQQFYYHEDEQLKTLITHFTRETLKGLSPEQAMQYCMPAEPVLETVRVLDNDRFHKSSQHDAGIPAILQALTDRYPPSQTQKKIAGRWPNAAWECGSQVAKVTKLLLESQQNLLLVGETGVGKSTIFAESFRTVHRLAQSDKNAITLWRSNAQRLIGKARYLGEWQSICDDTVSALEDVNGILWLNNLTQTLHTGGDQPDHSLAAYLQSFLQKRQLRIVSEMSNTEYEAAKRYLPAFIHQFEVMPIHEMSRATSFRVLKTYADYASNNFAIDTEKQALELAFQLTERFIKNEKNPGKQIRFYNECIKTADNHKLTSLSSTDILNQFIRYTGLPKILLDDTSPLNQADLVAYFKDKIKGQDHILKPLVTIIQTFKAGLNDPHKPVATLLLAGPTGVGKTALSRAIAAYFFEHGQATDPLIRIDMSEFQHPGHLGRLIGYDEKSPGKLIQHIREKPFSVILLDEIEKAHSSIFDVLLSLLDEGSLTDKFGRRTDFCNAIILLTTNLGVKRGTGMGFQAAESHTVSSREIQNFFRPEFFNRLDAILMFKPLNQTAIREIVWKELKQLQHRPGLQQHNIQLKFTDALVNHLTETGYSPKYGARPLQRRIESSIIPVLASYLLEEPLNKPLLTIDYVDSQMTLR